MTQVLAYLQLARNAAKTRVTYIGKLQQNSMRNYKKIELTFRKYRAIMKIANFETSFRYAERTTRQQNTLFRA
jgi:hypothetical protein